MADQRTSRPEWRPIISTPRTAWRTSCAEAAGVLVDAADYYRAFYAAASEAKHSILLSGWQFDRGVQLLRGDDVAENQEVRLVKFLNELCERTPTLDIYLLAWDFHLVFALEREWMQKVMFHWMTNERFHFRFDETAAVGGSHHQKFAVIDRRVAFLGGIDLCEARWDERDHRQDNPLRTSHGKPAKPYHDLQAYCAGCDVVDVLRDVFVDRWSRTDGPPLELVACEASSQADYCPGGALPIGGGELAFSRTDPRGQESNIQEIQELFTAAIAAAEQLIYIETQYFSAKSIRDALAARMQDAAKPKIEIVLVCNRKAEAIKEEIAVGLRQTKNVEHLRHVAEQTGHPFGVYYSLCDGEDPERPATYIHSKFLCVDDRFLTVGSANLTNRSMSVDTELHVSWETLDPAGEGAELARAIRSIRCDLLREHAGLPEHARDTLLDAAGLVERLNALTEQPNARLRKFPPPTESEQELLSAIEPDDLPFDPAKANYDVSAELLEEQKAASSTFVRGMAALFDRLNPAK